MGQAPKGFRHGGHLANTFRGISIDPSGNFRTQTLIDALLEVVRTGYSFDRLALRKRGHAATWFDPRRSAEADRLKIGRHKCRRSFKLEL